MKHRLNPLRLKILSGLIGFLSFLAQATGIALTEDNHHFNELVSQQSQLSPEAAELMQQFANALSEGRTETALETVNQLETLAPDNKRYCYLESIVLLKGNLLTRADISSSSCVTANPNWPAMLSLRASILDALSKPEDSLAMLSHALDLDPNNASLLLQRATLIIREFSGHPHLQLSALNDIERYTQHADQSDARKTVHLAKALIHLNRDNIREANALFTEALHHNLGDTYILQAAVKALLDKGYANLAKQHYLVARETRSEDDMQGADLARLRYVEASLAQQQEDTKTFELLLRQAISHDATHLEARKALIYFLDQNERLEEAIQFIEDGLALSPHDAYLTSYQAWAYVDTGHELDKAIAYLKTARKQQPDNPYLRDTEAWLAFRRGDPETAIELLNPALKYARDVPEIAFHAGSIYHALGELEKAESYLTLALIHDKTFNGKKKTEQLLSQLRQK